MRILLNVAQSQLGWFACVLTAAAGRPWIGVFAAAALIALHLAFADEATRETALVLAAAAVGALTDTLLVQAGVLHFYSGAAAGLTPLWMVALWMVFATTLRHSLAWLQSRLMLASLIGAAAGPLAYSAGARLGALQIAAELWAYAAIAALWAIALPVLLYLAHRLSGDRALLRRGYA